ncbi:MAG: hypothetical protein ACI865_002197 [Flavobacteriaceae bacterium]|jgi:hypothetical protein
MKMHYLKKVTKDIRKSSFKRNHLSVVHESKSLHTMKLIFVICFLFNLGYTVAQDDIRNEYLIYYADGQYEKAIKKSNALLKKKRIQNDSLSASFLHLISSMSLYQMSLDSQNCEEDRFECERLADSSVNQFSQCKKSLLEADIDYYTEHYQRLINYYSEMVYTYLRSDAKEDRTYLMVQSNLRQLVAIDEDNIHVRIQELVLSVINADTLTINKSFDSLMNAFDRFDFKAWKTESRSHCNSCFDAQSAGLIVWFCEALESRGFASYASNITDYLKPYFSGEEEFDEYLERQNKKRD